MKAELACVLESLFVAQESLKIAERLLLDDDDSQYEYIKKANIFFAYSAQIHWRFAIIELNTLFHDKEDFSITGFIRKLESGGQFAGLVSLGRISAWKEQIKLQEHIVEKVRKQRNKAIAHRDRRGIDEVTHGLCIRDLRALVTLVQTIAREIHFEVFGASFLVDQPINAPIDNLNFLLKEIVTKQNNDAETIRKLKRN